MIPETVMRQSPRADPITPLDHSSSYLDKYDLCSIITQPVTVRRETVRDSPIFGKEMKVYPGVNHAFHNDTGQRYVEAQATGAWLDTLAWFERHL